MNKNVIIIILLVLLLGLGRYLVYDKVIDKEDVTTGDEEQNEPINNVTIEQKDAEFFNEYLKVFTSSCDGKINVTKNTENFTNKDISNFVSGYYNLKAL